MRPFQLSDDQLRKVMANLNTEMTTGLKQTTLADNDLKMFPTYVYQLPNGQESGEVKW